MKSACGVAQAVIALQLWIVLFSIGLFVSSKPHIVAIQNIFSWRELVICNLVYTPTNTAILTCLAAIIGGCSSRLLTSQTDTSVNAPENRMYLLESPYSSMLRGFAIYLIFIAGAYISASSPFDNPTPEQYTRVGGIMGAIAFAAGYDPRIFRSILTVVIPKSSEPDTIKPSQKNVEKTDFAENFPDRRVLPIPANRVDNNS
jgi:hypothetical protein